MPESSNKIPVTHSATIEIGTDCPRECVGCGFKDAGLISLTAEEIALATTTLAQYWNFIGMDQKHQLIGNRTVELIGGAGMFNRMSCEDIRAILEVGAAHKLSQFAVLCDAGMDERAIKDFFREAAYLEVKNPSAMQWVIALSIDSLPKTDTAHMTARERKSQNSWRILQGGEYIRHRGSQKFRVFTTISKENLKDIVDIAYRVIRLGALLYIAPLTTHSPRILAKTGVKGRILMGTDTSILLNEKDRKRMKEVVDELRNLKKYHPEAFLNPDETFENMLAACKPATAVFQANCRERCAFILDGENLVATPNWRVMHRSDRPDMTLGVCTCMVGPTDSPDNYANTSLSALADIVAGRITTVDLYRKLTADLARIACPGCNCRTSLAVSRGEGLR